MRIKEYGKIVLYSIIFTYKIHIKWLPKINAVLENMIMPVIRGIFFILVADFINDKEIIFYITGTLCFTAVDASIGGVSTLISSEKRFGTLYTVMGSVYHSVFLFWGRIIYWCMIGYVRFLVSYFILFFIFLPDQICMLDFFWYSFIYFIISISLSGIGYFIGILGMMKRNIMGLSNLISTLLLMFSGVYFSVEILPSAFRWCSYFSPLFYGIRLSRNIMIDHSYSNVFSDIVKMLLLGIGYMAIGILYFGKIEKWILMDGRIDNF